MMRIVLVVSVVGQLLLTCQGKRAIPAREYDPDVARSRETKPPAEIPREVSSHEEVSRERKPPAPRREFPREFPRHEEAIPQTGIKPRVVPESFQPDPVEERVATGMKPSGGHGGHGGHGGGRGGGGGGGGRRGGGGRTKSASASSCSTPSAITVAAASSSARSFGTSGHHYDNYMKCWWKIQAPGNQRLRLHFNRFNLEYGSSNCPYDYVKVYNGPDTNANLVGKFCGPTVPGDIITTQSAAFVSFSSDYSITRSGLKIRYSRVSCKTLSYLNGKSGTFGTVGSYYGNYERCSWRIQVPQHKRVLLRFLGFNLEYESSCRYDSVKIFDGSSAHSTLKGTYCGTHAPSNFVSSGNAAFVSFTSDLSVVRPGVRIHYSMVSCLPLTVLTQPQGEFGTDGSPYGNYEKCSWKIQISGTNKRIRLHFTSFNLENGGSSCPYDYVAIYNGGSVTASLRRKVCGPNRPGDIVINGNTAFVKFSTDYSVTKPGFRIRYSVVGSSCTTPSVLTADMGSFGTSRSPYHNNEMCSWKIQVSRGKRVYLHCFKFDLELGSSRCPWDYVKVYDGSSASAPLKGKFCGKKGPVSLYSSGNTMFVTFKTDRSVTKAGFRCMYMGDSATGFDYHRGAPGRGGRRVVPRRESGRRGHGGGGVGGGGGHHMLRRADEEMREPVR